jgi:hypothetical protein
MRNSVVFPFLRLALRTVFSSFCLQKETHGMCIQSGFDDDDRFMSFSFWFLDHGLAVFPVSYPHFSTV